MESGVRERGDEPGGTGGAGREWEGGGEGRVGEGRETPLPRETTPSLCHCSWCRPSHAPEEWEEQGRGSAEEEEHAWERDGEERGGGEWKE